MYEYKPNALDHESYVPPFLPKRMKCATAKELQEATTRLRTYLRTMRQIYQDLNRSGKLADVLARMKQASIEDCRDELTIGYRGWLVREAVLSNSKLIIKNETKRAH